MPDFIVYVLMLASNTRQMTELVNFNINNWKCLVYWKTCTVKQVLHFKDLQYIIVYVVVRHVQKLE